MRKVLDNTTDRISKIDLHPNKQVKKNYPSLYMMKLNRDFKENKTHYMHLFEKSRKKEQEVCKR